MPKPKAPLSPPIPLQLLVPQNEAESLIKERIEKGHTLQATVINSIPQLEDAKRLYEKWDNYNLQLLKSLFSGDELTNEYSRWDGGIFFTNKSGEERVADFRKDVAERIHRLDSIMDRLPLISQPASLAPPKAVPTPNLDKTKVFIVHGHDDAAKLEVARFVEKIGFNPIIIHEQASSSRTIIEKIESYSDVGFGIVIYTPCDVGAKSSDPTKTMGRARQNVVFEHGFLIGKLNRKNVCALVKGDVETPNDISGIVYTSMDYGNWQIALAKELRASGYDVDMNKVI